MEIGARFEDDFFEEPILRKLEKSTFFKAKVYKPYWYMESTVADGDSRETLLTLKQQANFHYNSKNYVEAVKAYEKCLKIVPSSNSTWKREFLENIARSFLKLGELKKALEWSLKLDESSINEDQKAISMNLLALVCHKLGKFTEELEALHSCMNIHKISPEFWLRISLCYAGLFKINLPEYPLPEVEENVKLEFEPCCAFNLKHHTQQHSKQSSSVVPSPSLNSSDSMTQLSSDNGTPSNSLDDLSLTEKCEFCTLGIQIVSTCLIRTKSLLDSGGMNHLNSERDEQIKEKIAKSLEYMEVDESFIEIASNMLGTDFLALTDVCDQTIDPQKASSKQKLVQEKVII